LLLRLLFLFFIAYILILILKSYIIRAKVGAGSQHTLKDEEEMVLDPQCRAYVPKSEAVLRNGQYFCSQECANLFLSR
jgi:hypothetical protein